MLKFIPTIFHLLRALAASKNVLTWQHPRIGEVFQADMAGDMAVLKTSTRAEGEEKSAILRTVFIFSRVCRPLAARDAYSLHCRSVGVF